MTKECEKLSGTERRNIEEVENEGECNPNGSSS